MLAPGAAMVTYPWPSATAVAGVSMRALLSITVTRACSRGKLAFAFGKFAAFGQQHGVASGSGIFDGDAKKGIHKAAIADLLRDEPKRFRDPLQVVRFTLKSHREMPIAAQAVCG